LLGKKEVGFKNPNNSEKVTKGENDKLTKILKIGIITNKANDKFSVFMN